MDLLKEFLRKELNKTDLKITEEFECYNKLLLDWNSKINLISRKLTSIESNVLNSVFFITKYDISKTGNILDLGTGGGFPGIPLAILYKDIRFTLADSVKKKITALEDMINKLKLDNVEAVRSRAEDLSKDKKYFRKYDLVIAKSVSTLKNIYSWSKDFLNREGKIVCIKGGDTSDEIRELGKQIKIIDFDFDDKYKIEDKKIVIINIHK